MRHHGYRMLLGPRRLRLVYRTIGHVLLASTIAAGGILAAPHATGLPLLPQDPAARGSDCGEDSDPDPLWLDVKDATPQKLGNNVKVVFVAKTSSGKEYGYAVHDGQRGGPAKTKYDYLLIPTIREKGIECHRIWEPGALNLFGYAFDELGILPPGTDWALGIESAENRSHDQLHIHISRLADGVRKDLDAAEVGKGITTDVKQWSGDHITVKGRTFRALRNPNPKGLWDHNVFDTLAVFVAPNNPPGTKQGEPSMESQTLLITKSSKGGLIAIVSDKSLHDGANNIEFLLNKNV